MVTGFESVAAGFHTDEPRVAVEEAGERSDRVRPATHARDDNIGIVTEERAALAARFVADDALELAHHPREGVRSDDRPDAVVRGVDGRHPVAQRLVDRV